MNDLRLDRVSKMIIGNCHVWTSDIKVIKTIYHKFKKETYWKVDKEKRKNYWRLVLEEHKANQDLYVSVMTGRF